jgi:DNA polymerase-3 subunit epsilon/CBS domain-containing protein
MSRPDPVSNATPLIALDALVIDTETTGLDPVKARLIEIGGVRLESGAVVRDGAYRRLVRPPAPIPPATTAIHGFDDAMLAGEPQFVEVADEIATNLDRPLLLGHSVGFDLAILKAEFDRVGRAWTQPRSLCTRMLSEIAQPNLPDYSLEQVAGWLGVTPGPRHSAVGDAITAGRIFLALVPKLRERGIRTLAEAERAARQLTRVVEDHARAGWVVPSHSQPVGAEPVAGGYDLYPYRNRIQSVMRAPIVADGATTIADALRRMIEEKISSLLVAPSGATGPLHPNDIGIVTERDVMRAMAARGADALALPVGPFASRPLLTVPADAFAYRAIARMSRLRVRHLGVVSEDGSVAGVISARDLLRLRAREAIWLGDEIDEAQNVPALSRAWAKVPGVAAALRREGVLGSEVAALISEELRALTARAALLAASRTAADGLGEAPCGYTVAVLGSAGRGESLLALDQDNAVIYAQDGDNTDRWFAVFGQNLADILNDAGVPYCKGGVMASNSQWRGSLATWRARVSEWIAASKPEALLSVDIFFDLRGVFGERSLADTLWREALDQASGKAAFAKLLAESAGRTAPAVGLFGRLITENGRIDLKKAGLFGIVTAARVLAIRHHVAERATPARLDRLRSLKLGGDQDLEAMREAQEILLGFIIDQQLDDIAHGVPPSNSVAIKPLSAGARDRLRSALNAVRHADTLTRDLLFRG